MKRQVLFGIFCVSFFSQNLWAVVNSANEKQAVNANPLALMSGNIGGNYEYLLGGYHGFVAEASAGADSYSFGPGYRFHFAGTMESFFLGIYSRYFSMSGEMTEMDGSYSFESAGFAYGANAGKRWVWDNGVNLALRLGGGTANYKTEWKDGKEPAAKGFGDLAIRLVTSLDGELSLGYAF